MTSLRAAARFNARGRLASTGLVKLWLRAQVLGFLVKHSGNFYLPTQTWRLLRNSSEL